MCLSLTKTKPVSFEWLKNGQKITGHEENIRINTVNEVSALVFDPVTVNDSGNYTCSATNTYGTDKYTAVLEVKGMEVFYFYYMKVLLFKLLKIPFIYFIKFYITKWVI